jgi:hypothetical protein
VLPHSRLALPSSGSAGLWDACCDTWHTDFGFVRSLGDPCLYILTRGTARITMALATDDTAICVPHDKYHPGSQGPYEVYVAALQRDFKRPDGTDGFRAKGLATSFTGVSIDQSIPGVCASSPV